MKGALFVIMATLALAIDIARADDPSRYFVTNGKGEAVWNLNSYLKGTTSKIRDLVDGETDRMSAQCRQTQAEIGELTAEITKETAQALRKARASDDYKALVAQRDAAEQAKKDAHGQDLLDASSNANHAREAITKLESDAVAAASQADHDSLVKLQLDLAHHHASLTKAQGWRDNLIDSMRTTFLLEGPVHVGNRGILGKVTIDRVIDADSFVVRYDALEVTGVKDGGEGTETLDTRSHKTMLVLSGVGIDTSKLQKDDPIILDRNFEVTDSLIDSENSKATFIARPSPSEVDALMKAVVSEAKPD